MVLSDDMDLLVTGTKILLNGLLCRNNRITVYKTEEILNTLEINYDLWVDFCILCGCDYSKRIRGMGPNNSFKYLKECGNIEEIISRYVGSEKKFKELPKLFDYEKSRDLMKNCKHYISEYDNIRVELEPLFGNQMDIISKYIKKNNYPI